MNSRLKSLKVRVRRALVPPPAAGLLARAAGMADGRGRTLVLSYHRVNDQAVLNDPDPNAMIVDVHNFEGHMRVLSRWYDVVPLAEIDRPGRRGRRRVVITFDDGYEDNYTHALPILRRYGLPATVFVTSDMIDSAGAFWWDRLQRAVWALPPGRVELSPPCRDVVLTMEPMNGRRHSYRLVYAAVSGLGDAARERVISDLEAVAGGGPPLSPLPPLVTSAQLREMRGCGLEIGSHTCSHPRLGTLAHGEAVREIAGSKAALEAVVGEAVESFAYPFGGPEDFSAETVDAVRAAGYRRACSTIERLNGVHVDPFTLGRITVFDWDLDDFAYILLRHWAGWTSALDEPSGRLRVS